MSDKRIVPSFRTTTSSQSQMTKYFLGLALVIAASLNPTTSYAQKAQNDASSPRETFFDFQVDQPVKLKSGPTPSYPEHLRVARVEGRVLVQFVVDERGKPEMSSFKVIKS